LGGGIKATDNAACDCVTPPLPQEVAQGKSLAQMVGGGARATEQEVMRIAKELLAILQYLADLRPAVIHR